MAADAALESLRSLICALDIIFAIVSLSSLYVPLFWRSWTYEKGSIIRRDLWIARFIVLSSSYRLIGSIFSIASLTRNQQRQTLLLKTIQAVTATPLEIKLYKLARKTWKKAVRRQDGGDGPASDVVGLQPAVPKSREVLVAANAHRDHYEREKFGFWTACLFHFKWVIPEGIMVVGLVLSSIYLGEGPKDRLAPAVLIWILPLVAVILSQVWRHCRRTETEGVREFAGFTKPWAVGTMVGYLIFIVVFFVDLEERKGYINNWTEATLVWPQILYVNSEINFKAFTVEGRVLLSVTMLYRLLQI
ncbi:unnamed protein product [Clonostachys rhizophaga]|uniref:Uncharacterized protein n=1 Tax=Clonostachys rhizophaga TaxID=160324 RepID=A0A9N9VWW1_9HYPO|nr:unnamed protein product [Clonostachys rhizophaga]